MRGNAAVPSPPVMAAGAAFFEHRERVGMLVQVRRVQRALGSHRTRWHLPSILRAHPNAMATCNSFPTQSKATRRRPLGTCQRLAWIDDGQQIGDW